MLALMHPDVHWPNGTECGYVDGHEAVRAYWTRQWAMVDLNVRPVCFETGGSGRTMLHVRQVVRDLCGNLLSDSIVRHTHVIEDGLICSTEIGTP